MLVLDSLHFVFIAPIIFLFRLVLQFLIKWTGSAGLSIILLSLFVNLVLHRLYVWAESIQKKERTIRDSLAPALAEIKKNSRGEERFRRIQRLYEQNNYHPVHALRSLTGFAIQLPFFIAAWGFLGNWPGLTGESFGIVQDLQSPDGLLFGSVNLLPVVMTVFNLASVWVHLQQHALQADTGASRRHAAIYSKTARSEAAQLVILSFFFLVLLYRAPSGLVLYWTVNNVWALGRGVVGLRRCRKNRQHSAKMH